MENVYYTVADLLEDLAIAESREVNMPQMAAPATQSQMAAPTKYAYATLVMLGDQYLKGALTLAQSIRDSGSTMDIICIIDESVSAEARVRISRVFTAYVVVPIINLKVNPLKSKLQKTLYNHWISKSFTKWNIFNPRLMDGAVTAACEDSSIKGDSSTVHTYEKILFIDADALVRQNIDHLFQLSAPAACFSSPWSERYRADGRDGLIDKYASADAVLQHGDLVSSDAIVTALNFRSSVRVRHRSTFVAGASCVLISPSVELWRIFMEQVDKYRVSETSGIDSAADAAFGTNTRYAMLPDRYGNTNCSSGSDEQMLALCMVKLGAPITHIHQRFNWTAGKTNWYDDEKTTAVIHYCIEKPWDTRGKWEDTEQWWAIYERILADEKKAGIIVRADIDSKPTVMLRPKKSPVAPRHNQTQIMGRAIRSTSHASLPPAAKTTTSPDAAPKTHRISGGQVKPRSLQYDHRKPRTPDKRRASITQPLPRNSPRWRGIGASHNDSAALATAASKTTQ